MKKDFNVMTKSGFHGFLLLLCGMFMLSWQCDSRPRTSEKEPETQAASAESSAVSYAGTETEDQAVRRRNTEDISRTRSNTITRAVSEASPAVVGINVIQIRRYIQRSPFDDDPFWGMFFPPRQYMEKVKSLGSGFLISPDGYILTNEHVVHQAEEIIVTTTDGKQYQAESVGLDERYDVALLKIDGKDLPFIPLGNSDDIIIGEWVIALGNPFGLFDVSSKPTVTVGVISAVQMNFKGAYQIEGRNYSDMIQTDAAINGGNSGGPLVNSLGECIAINTFIISGSQVDKTSVGIGFAIPVNRVKKILPDLEKFGRVDRSFTTGLEVENLDYLMARMLGISPSDGVIVSEVADNSPADEAGVRVGDVIVAINGRRVRSTRDVRAIINGVDITEDKSIQLKLFRDKKLRDVNVGLK